MLIGILFVAAILTIVIPSVIKFMDYRYGDLSLDIMFAAVMFAFFGSTVGGTLTITILVAIFSLWTLLFPLQLGE